MSRGEIGIISLFLPILDHQIQRKLTGPSQTDLKHDCRDTVVLMDSPSPFLSCEQQFRLLEYLRTIVEEEDGHIQFIIVTGSPALTDKATAEELFMLMPPDRLVVGANQLVKVTDTNVCLA